ncbi:MAG: hypothetical protein SFY67_01410 [Candidatus Melainabacteria bacterium]|nr:hypothetical protein [Candidatus Melainabacteria bacterium]
MTHPASIEIAFSNLQKIVESVKNIELQNENEAEARLKLIDPILTTVLGWLPENIKCEQTLDKSRLDYLLTTSTGGAVVEAKRPALLFDLETEAQGKQSYPLNGAVLKSGSTGEALSQVKGYAQKHGINLAAATNGIQWVIFLASREDGVPPDKGFGFVFRSLEQLLKPDIFRLFYSLMSKTSVLGQSFKSAFYKAEGRISTPRETRSSRLVQTMKGADQRRRVSDMAKALDPVIQQLFITMSPEKEKEIIRECFVTTKESQDADTRLQRLLDEVTESIQPIDTREDGNQRLQVEIEQGIAVPDSRTVVIVGQIGAGKSTYLERFFFELIPEVLRKKILHVRLNLEKSRPDQGTFVQFLRKETIRGLEVASFGSEYPKYEQLKGAFYSLYQQLSKGKGKPFLDADPVQLDILFTNTLEEMKLSNEEEYLRLLLAHCNNSLRRMPVVIYDNIDHHSNEIQTLAFQQAQWLSGLGRVFSILPVRDSTYWQASAEGPFHTHTHVTLYLPRPPIDKVLARRFKYAELQLDDILADKGVVLTSLTGIKVKIEKPKELFQVLYKLFSKERYPNHLLRSLSGGNIRQALTLFHQTITSPHIPIDKLLAAYLAQSNYRLTMIDKSAFDKAAILGNWSHYKFERSRSVINMICTPRLFETSPLLGLRILERMYELRTENHIRAGIGFESVKNLLYYFGVLGVPHATTEECILYLIDRKLLEPHDVSIFADSSVPLTSDRIEFVCLAPSGRLHRTWVRDSRSYGLEMIWDMAISSEETNRYLQQEFQNRLEYIKKKNWVNANNCLNNVSQKSIAYLKQRDSDHISVPNDLAYLSQKDITERIFAWANNSSSELWEDEEE